QPELVLPAAGRAQGVELVLLEDVGGEAVGVGAGAPLRVGQQIDLAVGLLERLDYFPPLQPVAPGEDLVCRPVDRVPEGNGRLALEAQGLAAGPDQFAAAPDPVDGLALRCEGPDQPAGDGADQGVVQVALAPG